MKALTVSNEKTDFLEDSVSVSEKLLNKHITELEYTLL